MSDHDDQCESWWEIGAMASTPCRCAERASADPAALTDEELAQWEAMFPGGAVTRLIAALRASRAEVEQLREAALRSGTKSTLP